MFSSIFGSSATPTPLPETTIGNNNINNENGNNNNNNEPKWSGSGFDPTGLERAAKAAKELQSVPFAEKAIELQKEQEKTKQFEASKQAEENKARAQAFAAERVRLEHEERRKTEQQALQLNDQLTRKRHQDQLQAQAAMRAQELKRQEESQMRIEQLKRETAQYEAQLRKETDAAKVELETKGRISQERANFDLRLQQSKLEAMEFRETVMEGIKEVGAIVGSGVRDYLTDWEKLSKTVGALSLLALGVYSARVSTSVAGRVIEARLGKPPLVRETSRKTFFETIAHPIKYFSSLAKPLPDALQGVVIEPKLRSHLENIARATINTRKNRAPYRHALLYGPPGTGKTLFAKQLAQASGMDYAILTGGDVAPLGRDAVTELHKLFDWANSSRKGLLIFVDEADAFLRKRTNETMSEDLRNALNAFLYRTGTESMKFQVIFASNKPEQLDSAVLDRTDEAVLFELPGEPERLKMIKQYFELYVVKAKGSKPIAVDENIKDSMFEQIAKATNGFSGREIAKLAIAWQSSAYGTKDCKLTLDILNDVVAYRIMQHKQKNQWHLGESIVTSPTATITKSSDSISIKKE